MKIKIVMDSGKIYIVEDRNGNYENFIEDNFLNIKKGAGGRIRTLKNDFVEIKDVEKEETIWIVPVHISSMEIIRKYSS